MLATTIASAMKSDTNDSHVVGSKPIVAVQSLAFRLGILCVYSVAQEAQLR